MTLDEGILKSEQKCEKREIRLNRVRDLNSDRKKKKKKKEKEEEEVIPHEGTRNSDL